jgi:hypothetical protein
MAILMIAEFNGVTTGDYDELNRTLGIDADHPPDGLISHAAGPTDDGLLIVDTWESEEALNHFFAERVGPAMKQMGMAEQPQPRVHPVHNQIVQGAGRKAGTILLIEAEGFDADAYDRLTVGMDAHSGDGSNHPAVSHVAAVADRGMVIVDVWESPEEFGRFAEHELASAQDQIGPMEPRFVQLHNRLVGKS